ncbi:hypothetical protein NUU61_004448 [Penicillium alfredii]|uniref:Uncharacterized protein n=1 Tax=Penicillium alfredii TaxID=1506179 RepID=A0A9W9KDV5_9EURO|nr:uncharacterized protein NUU61_004448 [Penicillium alfredii]KAJ5102226.1 hypothetical protein NUU61_004448 [Penicillium alfredii]
MSLDRVIQDSDEEDPLVEESAPTSIDAPQKYDPQWQQIDHASAELENHAAIDEHRPSSNAGPQINVNFDDFLQSQEMAQTSISLSQQRREERWIPSTSDGGGGSIGKSGHIMVTAYGRGPALDDIVEGSMALIWECFRCHDDGNRSCAETAAGRRYVQCRPAITFHRNSSLDRVDVPGFNPYSLGVYAIPFERNGKWDSSFLGPANGIPYGTNSGMPPTDSTAYDPTAPATSNYAELLPTVLNGTSIPATEHSIFKGLNEPTLSNGSQKATHRSKSLQMGPYSPNDTEPMSSVNSPRMGRAKSDHAALGLISPWQSQTSAHDELSLPAAPVDISTAKKKRGRPKKQSLPENDEDDELANSRDHEFDQSATEKRRPGRPPKNAESLPTNGDQVKPPSNGVPTSGVNGSAPSINSQPIDEGSNQNTETPLPPAVDAKPVPAEPKKKKVKRGKTTSAAATKSLDPDIEDDVIWVESRPLHVDAANNANSETGDAAATSSFIANTRENGKLQQADQAPAPKKRGRKRKKTTDQATADSTPGPETEQPPETAPGALNGAQVSVVVEGNPTHISEPKDDQPKEIPMPQNPPSAKPESVAAAEPINESPTDLPQTPSKSQEPGPSTPQNTGNGLIPDKDSRKGPGKHSPIASTGKVPYRVGLSRKARIAPLLKIVRK